MGTSQLGWDNEKNSKAQLGRHIEKAAAIVDSTYSARTIIADALGIVNMMHGESKKQRSVSLTLIASPIQWCWKS